MFDFKGAIFDLDGTIANSLYVWKKVDIDFFGKRGLEIPDGYAEKIGSMSFNDAAKFTKEEYGFSESVDEIMAEWYDMAVNEYSFNVKPKPFAKEYIEYIKENGVKIALCTASPKMLYEPFLKNNGMYDYFDAFVSGTEVSRGKEFPDIYLLASDRLKVKPYDCVVFEDIYKATIGAKSAGMRVFGVFDIASQKDADIIKQNVEKYINDFSEIYDVKNA